MDKVEIYTENKANIREIVGMYNAWTIEKFPNSTPISSLKGLKREVEETIEAIESFNIADKIGKLDGNNGGLEIYHDAVRIEYADCLMYLIDSARRFGLSVDDLFFSLDEKLQINLQRQWKQNDDLSYSHIKS